MTIILTNIGENILNQNIIKETFTKLKNQYELKEGEELTEIFYLNEKISTPKWSFKDIKLNKFEIAMDEEMEEVYSNINKIIKDILDKKEFVNVIVDNSFLAYIILEILIKNFNITDVFILENDELKKAHPCGCGPEYMGY
ncbi:hypothetical protein MBCUT_11380 [Methanobrevibacter cuticularis]|uniref:Uncharacterized protein n=1 Tax=Methanobrevibacter cuticularis TaxID=47311 RepID=A0A166DVS5_9EURY|nr:hypothetical protein [Methanobrevibacter cuticularis]KZX16002.1 hypothetical protein MBCUT_11380 [Methanobrevibacter cuticularis]